MLDQEHGEQQQAVVFIVDDDASVRDSLRWLIESVQLKVKCYSTAQEFLDDYGNQQTGCVVLDVRMLPVLGSQVFGERSVGSL